ncbi:hypothetical protein D0863_06869 [Hortaea werneckii]|uniref:Uncharacterized protein n=1 Tax=Hortaea werneckii TaxID=91943 RepID=A0A3M7DX45_HORWE|nr:hypothetical protein D0863_06869 [Hortaea werneckii]
MPILASAALSICLSLAIIGCAGRSLSIFDSQQASNAWLLPIWPNHFDTRELHALIGTSAAVLVLNLVLIAALFIPKLPTALLLFISSSLSTICALVAIAFPATLNAHAPRRDTLRSWTCRWSNTLITQGSGPPAQFETICRETVRITLPVSLSSLHLFIHFEDRQKEKNKKEEKEYDPRKKKQTTLTKPTLTTSKQRFAFYTTIPLFLLQLLLLLLAFFSRKNRYDPTKSLRSADIEEKGQSQHELHAVRQVSLGSMSEGSPGSVQRVQMGGKGIGVA